MAVGKLNTNETQARFITQTGDASAKASAEKQRAARLVEARQQDTTASARTLVETLRGGPEARPTTSVDTPARVARAFDPEIVGPDGTNLRDKDPAGEAAKKTSTQESLALQKQLAERGFDSITDPAKKAEVISQVTDLLNTSPEMAKILTEMGADAPAFVERIVRSPQFAKRLAEVNDSFGFQKSRNGKVIRDREGNPEPIPFVDPAEIRRLQGEFNTRNTETQTQKGVVDTQERKVNQDQRKLDLVAVGERGATAVADKGTELITEGGRLNVERLRLEAIATRSPAEEAQLQQVIKDEADNAELGVWFRDHVYNPVHGVVGFPPFDAVAERTAQNMALTTANTELTTAKNGLNARSSSSEQARLALEGQIQLRLKQEADLANEVNQGVGLAAIEWVNDEVAQFEKYYSSRQFGTTEGQIATELTTDNKFAVAMQGRYQERGRALFGLKKFERANKANINEDYAQLMRGDIAGFMNKLVPADIPAEERAKMINSKEFQTQAVQNLLYWRARNGGISRMDVDVLVNAPWGKDALKAALKNNQEAQDMYDQLVENGLASGDFSQWLTKQGNKNALTLILGLLLGVGGLAMAGVVGAPALLAGGAVLAGAGVTAGARKVTPNFTTEQAA